MMRIDILADCLTVAHLKRDGFCSESHMAEAELVAKEYAERVCAEWTEMWRDPTPMERAVEFVRWRKKRRVERILEEEERDPSAEWNIAGFDR